MKDKWYCYVVQCNDGTYYTGISNDVDKRIATHNKGKGARYTKTRRPVVLLWKTMVGTMGEAMRLERRIKSMSRSQKQLFLRERNSDDSRRD